MNKYITFLIGIVVGILYTCAVIDSDYEFSSHAYVIGWLDGNVYQRLNPYSTFNESMESLTADSTVFFNTINQ